MNFWPKWKENPVFAVLLIVLLAAVVVLLGVKTWNDLSAHSQIGRAPLSRDTITIDGEGKIAGKPTLAVVDVGLYAEGQDVPTVQQSNSAKVNAIIAAMKGLGIADVDLQTSNYNISPKFDYKNGTQNVVGYTVSQSLSVKVRDLAKVSAVLAKAGQLGANQINGVTFTIDDPSELKQEARKKALDDAYAKAKELSDAMHVQVAKVVTFSEATSPSVPQPYLMRSDVATGGGNVSPDIQAGSLDVVSHVSVTFEIR